MATTTGGSVRVLALAGSHRRESLNQVLLGATLDELPRSVEVERFDLRRLPFFDEDVERAGGTDATREFAAALEDADAVVIATPEYNGGLPALVKNALDWGSRPYGDHPFIDKPVVIVAASPGKRGARGALAELFNTLTRLGAQVVDPPLALGSAPEHIDGGRLTTPEVRRQLRVLGATLLASAPSPASIAAPAT